MTEPGPKPASGKNLQFVGVHFKCCKVYTRVYIDPRKSKHLGFCPKCGGKVEIVVSPDGSKSRFFDAG